MMAAVDLVFAFSCIYRTAYVQAASAADFDFNRKSIM
jgi:hypothetical protein